MWQLFNWRTEIRNRRRDRAEGCGNWRTERMYRRRANSTTERRNIGRWRGNYRTGRSDRRSWELDNGDEGQRHMGTGERTGGIEESGNWRKEMRDRRT